MNGRRQRRFFIRTGTSDVILRHIARMGLAGLFALFAAAAACAAPDGDVPRETIARNLAQRLPDLPRVEEVRKTAIPGLFEVRVGDSDIIYTDAAANYVVQGEMLDLRTRRNLTQERVDALSTIPFASLPVKDAITIKYGNGSRQLAVFEDPNCPYCHRFEQDLQKVGDVTVHVFLYPVLGPDSQAKAQAIWCARDSAAAWKNWMLRKQVPAPANCDTGALRRNVALGQKARVTGTPTLFFIDGSRVPGAIDARAIEQKLAAAR